MSVQHVNNRENWGEKWEHSWELPVRPTRFFCNPKTAQIIQSIKNKNTKVVISTWEKNDTRQAIPGEEKAMLLYFHKIVGEDLPEKRTLEQRLEEMRGWAQWMCGFVKQNRVVNNLEVVLGLVCLTKSKDVSTWSRISKVQGVALVRNIERS